MDWVASGKTEAAAAEADRYVHTYIYRLCIYICMYIWYRDRERAHMWRVDKEKGMSRKRKAGR